MARQFTQQCTRCSCRVISYYKDKCWVTGLFSRDMCYHMNFDISLLARWLSLNFVIVFAHSFLYLSWFSRKGFKFWFSTYCSVTVKWENHMMTSSNENIFRVTGPLCGEFTGDRWPHKGQWRGALLFTLICVWTNGWVNTRDAGDLGRHRAHYDVTVMECGRRSGA